MGQFDPWKESAPQEGRTVDEAVAEFLRYREEVKEVRKKTLSNYQYTLEAFADTIPVSMNIRYVDADDIRQYIKREKLSQTSRDTYYRQLKTFFRWCVSEGMIEDSPIEDVERPGARKKPPEYLTPEQLSQLLKEIEENAEKNAPQVGDGEVLWLVDVIKFAVFTGLRRGEICDLRWGAVNLDSGFLTVQRTDDFETKTGHDARIPLIEEAADILRRKEGERTGNDPSDFVFTGANEGKLRPDYLSHRFRHYRKMAGLPEDVSFHTLRHTCASFLVMGGVPIHTVKKMLRHSTIEVTKRYAHLDPASFKNQVEEGMSASIGRGE